MLKIVEVPTQLPDGWRASSDSRGVVIDAFDAEGRNGPDTTVGQRSAYRGLLKQIETALAVA